MSDTFDWLSRYTEAHTNLANPYVYWAALPMLIVGFVGLLWNLPSPEAFLKISPLLNWGSAFLMATAVYYFIISLSLAIGLLPLLLGVAGIQLWLPSTGYPPLAVCAGLLFSGLVGLLLGRRAGPLAVVGDVQLMMLGPPWALEKLYRRVGIPI